MNKNQFFFFFLTKLLWRVVCAKICRYPDECEYVSRGVLPTGHWAQTVGGNAIADAVRITRLSHSQLFCKYAVV